jgi:magnesium transporter
MGAQRVLAETLLRAHPADAAALLERIPAAGAADLFASLPAALAGAVVECMEPWAAVAVLSSMEVESAAAVVGALTPAVAAVLLRRAPAAAGEAWLAHLPTGAARRLRAVAAHAEGSAAALADLQALALPGDGTAAQALARMRQTPASVHPYVYVLDRAQHLAGALSLRELLVADAEARLDALRQTRVETLPAHADAAAIVAHPAWRALRSLPVVDANGIFLGAVHDDTRRRLERDAATAPTAHAVLGTMLTLGEAYWVGVGGLLGGVVAAFGRDATPTSTARVRR